jgi:arginase
MRSAPIGTSHLRLVWPQWQGAGTESIRSLAPEFPFEVARRGYSIGTKVLEAILPGHDGPTAVVPVEMGDTGLEERDGIEAKTVVLRQLRAASTSSRPTTRPGSPPSAASAR